MVAQIGDDFLISQPESNVRGILKRNPIGTPDVPGHVQFTLVGVRVLRPHVEDTNQQPNCGAAHGQHSKAVAEELFVETHLRDHFCHW